MCSVSGYPKYEAILGLDFPKQYEGIVDVGYAQLVSGKVAHFELQQYPNQCRDQYYRHVY